jgi:hypothetical protein
MPRTVHDWRFAVPGHSHSTLGRNKKTDKQLPDLQKIREKYTGFIFSVTVTASKQTKKDKTDEISMPIAGKRRNLHME